MLCQCNDLSLLIVTHIHSIILCNIYLSHATPLRVPPLRVNHFLQFNNKIDSMIWKRRGVEKNNKNNNSSHTQSLWHRALQVFYA